MRIDVLHVPACPNVGPAIERLREAVIAIGVTATVHAVEVASPAAALRTGMRGSPTILIDGTDPFPAGPADPSLSCRLYPTGDGLDGAPSVAQLRAALAHVIAEHRDLGLNKATAVASLSDGARDLHRSVLARFAEAGCSPTRAELEGGEFGTQFAFAELAERDVIAFDAAGEIRAAYPFSPTPTAVRVTWDGGPGAYAMCAVDALGMSAMLGRLVTIVAADVTVTVDGSEARWTPESAVVFAGAAGDACCPSVDRTCSNINFFPHAAAALAWATDHPDVTGAVLSIPDALAWGVAEFGTVLANTHVRTDLTGSVRVDG